MPLSLLGLNSTPRSDTLNTVSWAPFPSVSPGAGVANSAIQAVISPPTRYKIRKVSVYFSAIDALTGDSFNIVVGTGTYTQNNAAPNDNSFDQALPGGVGYPTNVATAGMSVFAADVVFNATSFSNIATGTGGYGIVIPTNYDAVYSGGTPLTLRVTTNASTGSITGLIVSLAIVPVRLRVAPPGSEAVYPVPGVDY
jgi:hypothetical protein